MAVVHLRSAPSTGTGSGPVGSQHKGVNGWKKMNLVLESVYGVQPYNGGQAGFVTTYGRMWSHGIFRVLS